MQTIRLLLVSTFLIYNEIRETLSDPKRACENISTRRTLLKPYMSIYNNMFNDCQNGICKNKSRNVLSAKVNKTIKAPFKSQFWDRIVNPISPVNDVINFSESLDNKIFENYLDLKALVILKIDNWLNKQEDPKNLSMIEDYFGFDPDMVPYINMSITILMSNQRRGLLNIQNDLTVLYCIFDVRNVIVDKSNSKRFEIITTKLKRYFDAYDYDEKTKILTSGESKFKYNFIDYVHNIDEKTYISFGVSIPAMKFRALTIQTKNEVLKSFQNLKPFFDDKKTISEYVKSYAKEYDAYKINAYHVSILSVLITHVFGYVHKHFMLLLKLQNLEIEDVDKNTIEVFSTFMNGYMSILVDRYFEFKGEISQEIVDAMFSIMFFLSPLDTQQVDGKDLTEEEIKILSAPEKPAISILNYYDKSEEQHTLKIRMEKLVNDGFTVLFNSFTHLVKKDKLINGWNKELEIDMTKQYRKNNLMDKMKKNTKNAFSILETIACEFTV